MNIVSAVRVGDSEVIRELLDGSNVNIQDEHGNTGLIVAAETGNIEILHLLLLDGCRNQSSE